MRGIHHSSFHRSVTSTLPDVQWLAFAIWIAYGVIQAKRWPVLRERMLAVPAARRKLLAPILMFSGAAGMLVGMSLIAQMGGIEVGQLKPWAWGAVTLLGLAFVHAQTMATLMIVSLIGEQETQPTAHTFQGKDADEPSTRNLH